MSAIRYINRMKRIDYLIRTRSTGNAGALSLKLGISVRSVYVCLNDLKELGAPVQWSSDDNSYIYRYDGRLEVSFIGKSMEKQYK